MLRRLVAIALLTYALPARAYPFLALRPGGTPFEGVTDGEISAVWWNPAALAQVRGFHLGGTGQLVFEHGSVDRTSICTATGLPGDCGGSPQRSFPSSPIAGISGAGLGGVMWDFRQDNLTAAFAVFSPWESHRSFSDGGSGAAGSAGVPTAYHLRDESFSTIYYALALGFRLATWFNAGVSLALSDSSVNLAFDRDAALGGGSSRVVASGGFENPDQAQRIRVRGDGGAWGGAIPAPTGLSLTLGTLFRVRENLDLGVSYTHMFTLFGGDRYASTKGDGAELTAAKAQNNPCAGQCTGGAAIEYDLPDVVHLGMKYRLRPTVELESTVRLVAYGGAQPTASSRALVVRLSGDPVTKAGAPARILFAHALQPTVAGEVGVRWRPRPWVRLGLSVAAETSAVPSEYVDAEALDGPKLDAMVGAEVRPIRWLRLMLGYEITGLVFTSANSPAPGAFNPNYATGCADANFALGSCGEALEGRGLPTAAGAYSLITHRLSAGVVLDIN